MALTTTLHRTVVLSVEPLLDVERFEVYRVALEFQQLVPRLLPRKGCAALRDQLDRASSSILLCLAEGVGRFSRADKANFYTMARGSTMESAAVLDVLVSRGLLEPALHRQGRWLLVRVAQMLTKLILRMQSDAASATVPVCSARP